MIFMIRIDLRDRTYPPGKKEERTVKCYNTEDEHDRKNKDNHGINLQSWRLIGVKSYSHPVSRN
jgi:hypothetical protein